MIDTRRGWTPDWPTTTRPWAVRPGQAQIARIQVIKNNTFVHTVRPEGSSSAFEYRDGDIKPGESYYYVRVEQAAGQLAWSSPIWVNYSR